MGSLFNFEGSFKKLEKTAKSRITIWGCSSAGRAPALQAGGHGFESHHLHHRQVAEDKRGEELHRIALFRAQSEGQGRTNTSLAAEPTPHNGS